MISPLEKTKCIVAPLFEAPTTIVLDMYFPLTRGNSRLLLAVTCGNGHLRAVTFGNARLRAVFSRTGHCIFQVTLKSLMISNNK